ncbi:unnamed protein product [Closterium sp. NIES-53]
MEEPSADTISDPPGGHGECPASSATPHGPPVYLAGSRASAQKEGTALPPSRHLRPETPPPQQEEPAAGEDAIQGRGPRQREQELPGRDCAVPMQRRAADLTGAHAGDESRGPARRALNCSDSVPPSPRARPLTPPAEGLPSSRVDDTRPHARGDPSSPPGLRGARASVPAADSGGENRVNAETTCAPGGTRANGDATGAQVGQSAQQGETQQWGDPLRKAPAMGPGHQWWRTPLAGTRQRPEQARKGQQQAAQRARQGQEWARQGQQQMVERAGQEQEQAQQTGRPEQGPGLRQRALATAQELRQSPSQAQGGRGAGRRTESGAGGGPENGYQAAARAALNNLEAANEEDEIWDPSYREETAASSETDEGEEEEGGARARERSGRREAAEKQPHVQRPRVTHTPSDADQTGELPTIASPARSGRIRRNRTANAVAATRSAAPTPRYFSPDEWRSEPTCLPWLGIGISQRYTTVVSLRCHGAYRQTCVSSFQRGEWEQLYQDAADAVNAPPPPRHQPDTAGVLSRAEGLAKRGSLRRAVLALESTPVCTPSPKILEELRLKHPPAEPGEVTWPTPQGSTLSIPHADFAKMLGRCENGVGAEPSGMTFEHLRDAAITNALVSIHLHALVNTILGGNLPASVENLLTASRLIALATPRGGAQPIAIGECLTRLAAKAALSAMGVRI